MKFYYSFNIPTQTFERGVKECENESSFTEWMTQKAMEICSQHDLASVNCSYAEVGKI